MPLWLNHALQVMAAECNGRAFTEVAEWNQAILASLKKTPFRRLGSAAKLTILHHTIVWWEQANPSQEPKGELKKVSI